MPSNRTEPRPKQAAGVNTELFKALSVPLRGRIMVVLTERVASAKELAHLLGDTEENVAYHLRKLHDVDLIEQVGESRTRARFYKANARPVIELESFEKLPKIVREINSIWVGQLLLGDAIEAFEDMLAAMKAQTFDARPGRTMIRMPMVVDEKGWEELEPVGKRYLEGLFDVQAKSASRLSKSGEPGINVSASALAFEMPSKD